MARRFTALTISVLVSLTVFSCRAVREGGSDSGLRGTVIPGYEGANKLRMARQWEIRTDHLETVVPDIYYADKSQNQQLMPTDVDLGGGLKYGIDHVIYPTIGNPNLYTREMPESKVEDSLLTVLRLTGDETSGAKVTSTINPGSRNFLVDSMGKENKHEYRFYLVARAGRKCAEMNAPIDAQECRRDSYRIKPSKIVKQNEQRVPKVLASRSTFSFYFDKKAMSQVPAVADMKKRVQENGYKGMYDLKVEYFQGGRFKWREFHYNSVRAFEVSPGNGDYNVLNITDTQMSINEKIDHFKKISLDQTRTIVTYLNKVYSGKSNKKVDNFKVRTTDFISFNGDLHNGGSPATLGPDAVANAYRRESAEILKVLRDLPIPIFLTIGNHDGYSSAGHAPGFPGAEGKLKKVIAKAAGPEAVKAWENYIAKKVMVKNADGESVQIYGGKHLNIFQGTFVRRFSSYTDSFSGTDEPVTIGEGKGISDLWYEVPPDERNVMLVDGFNQWRRTYGPTYSSWKHGKNHYININSYDIRQHRRAGWGMYTVNYGGGTSGFQRAWYREQIATAKAADRDIVLIAHHDPRGGHNGHDYPFYFKHIEFLGMGDSAKAYVQGEIINPKLCKYLPKWSQTSNFKLSCLHDGLQEWMRPDAQFDCEKKLLKRGGPQWALECDIDRIRTNQFEHPFYSGYDLIHKITQNKEIRTVLLGHTHYSSIEVYQAGAPFAPTEVILDADAMKRWAELELAQGPARGFGNGTQTNAGQAIPRIAKENKDFIKLLLKYTGNGFKNKMLDHEVAIIRLTSSSDMSSQLYGSSDYFGFSVLEFQKKSTNPVKDKAQLSGVFVIRSKDNGKDYSVVGGKDNELNAYSDGHIKVDRNVDVRYRKLDEIKSEFAEDYKYLKAKGVDQGLDQRNPFRARKYDLKTEDNDDNG